MANTRYRNGPQQVAMADFTQRMLAARESSPLRRSLSVAIRDELTPRQREVLSLYYGEGLTLEKIGGRLGIDKSTVSRTLHRGEARLGRCLKYGAGRLLKAASPEEV